MAALQSQSIAIARGVKQRLIRFQQGPRPSIAIFGIRRGGSTQLADMIADQRGVYFIDEPCAIFPTRPRYELRRRLMPDRRHSQFFDLNEAESRQVEGYLGQLLQARLRLGTCRRTRFPLAADRVLLKLLNLPALIDWMAERFPIQFAYLTRHPAAQALSVLRQNWEFSAEAYFERPDFLAHYLRGDQIEFGSRLQAEGSDWQKAILNWVIENIFPLQHTRTLLFRLTHEELNLRTEAVAELLCDHFSLEERDRPIQVARRLSGSSRLSSPEHQQLIVQGDRTGLLRSWQKKVDAGQANQAQEILDRFGITIYSMSDYLPAPPYRLCEPSD